MSLVGIVGLGDLGSQLKVQVQAAGFEVMTFEPGTPRTAQHGIDPLVVPNDLQKLEKIAGTLGELLTNCSIIHWCAPLEALANLCMLPPSSTLVLHNSVMHSSVLAREHLKQWPNIQGSIQIVHCLMNPAAKVIVADNFTKTDKVVRHIKEIKLSPLLMPHKEHDHIIAQSQGICALLLNIGLLGRLKSWDERGLLVTSSQELLKTLENRQFQWTSVTMNAILKNPQLGSFAEELAFAVKEK